MEGSGRPRRTEEEGQLEEIREEMRRRRGGNTRGGGEEGKGYPGNLDKTTNALWMEGKQFLVNMIWRQSETGFSASTIKTFELSVVQIQHGPWP